VAEQLTDAVRDLARRAGLGSVPVPALAAAIAVAILACSWAVWSWWPRAESGQGAEFVSAAPSDPSITPVGSQPSTTQPETPLVVHVAGAVRHPGLYHLDEGSRIGDAVDAAGGTLPDAVVEAINLARPLTDGEQVLVPDEDTVDAAAAPVSPSAQQIGAAGAGAAGPVDLNGADAALLDTLPGVGPSTADKIVADRESNGPFKTVEDLGRVSGIGPKKLEQLRDLVIVR